MSRDELDALAAEIRTFLVTNVSRTGGHLGPNLGVVELTLALHRVFDSPRDTILWDTGHQAYVHKILTGRQDDFPTLKQRGGLSGYPSRAESPHDVIENSHASTALSWADGLAKARQLSGESRTRAVVAVVGDGALTGGMAWEAINNIAAGSDRPLVIVVNDNARSYAPTIGGLAHHLATLRTTRGYERFLEWGAASSGVRRSSADRIYETLHGMKKGIKDIVAPQGMFEDLGLKYIGPVDGHDVEAVEHALRRARAFGGPVIVHAITHKGRGHAPAENDQADHFHGIGVVDPETGRAAGRVGPSWTNVFADEMVERRQRRVPTSSPSPPPCSSRSGFGAFARAHPDRVFDVGIAEQHAATSAAGMAYGGLHPVVAVYATFLNRAFDQVLMDVALHKAGVTFVLDHAGVTGDDGASHNGMWDLSRAAGRARACASPRRATPRRCATSCARRSTSTTRRPSCASPRRAVGDDIAAVEPGRWHGRARARSGDAGRAASCPSGRWRRPASRSPTGWPTRASASRSSTRAGSSRWTPRCRRWPRRTGSS